MKIELTKEQIEQIKKEASQPAREVGYRVIKKGCSGVDFGFIYSEDKIEECFYFSDESVRQKFVEKVEKPLEGEEYWYIDDNCEMVPFVWLGNELDELRWKIGNVYNSYESAERHLKRLTNIDQK